MKFLRQRIVFFFLLSCLARLPAAHAAEDPATAGSQELSNPFSDFVPFEDEYDLDEDERFMYFGRFFALSLGTGMHTFTGNIGKLYNTALPVLDFKMIYFFDFRLAGQIGISSASHAFTAAPTGAVDVSILAINADMKYYFDTKDVSAAISMTNPYAVIGVSPTFRTQAFQDLGSINKDTALGVSGGLGMEFALKPRKTSLSVEGRLHQIFFKDRLEETYAPSGVPDQTGFMYSVITSVIFFF